MDTDPTYGIPPDLDDPSVRFITLEDPGSLQPWLIVRLWPMSSTWNNQMFGWFLDILDLNRQMIPPPKNFMILQASNGAWLPITTLEHSYRLALDIPLPSQDEKYFVMEGSRLMVYRGLDVIGEITIPLHSQRKDPMGQKDFRVLRFDAK